MANFTKISSLPPTNILHDNDLFEVSVSNSDSTYTSNNVSFNAILTNITTNIIDTNTSRLTVTEDNTIDLADNYKVFRFDNDLPIPSLSGDSLLSYSVSGEVNIASIIAVAPNSSLVVNSKFHLNTQSATTTNFTSLNVYVYFDQGTNLSLPQYKVISAPAVYATTHLSVNDTSILKIPQGTTKLLYLVELTGISHAPTKWTLDLLYNGIFI